MFLIKKNHIDLRVSYSGGEVFLLSDHILTAYDFSARTFTSSEAALANGYIQTYNGMDKEEELKRYFDKRGWKIIDQ